MKVLFYDFTALRIQMDQKNKKQSKKNEGDRDRENREREIKKKIEGKGGERVCETEEGQGENRNKESMMCKGYISLNCSLESRRYVKFDSKTFFHGHPAALSDVVSSR